MNADECRNFPVVVDNNGGVQALWEIAAQLAELNAHLKQNFINVQCYIEKEPDERHT